MPRTTAKEKGKLHAQAENFGLGLRVSGAGPLGDITNVATEPRNHVALTVDAVPTSIDKEQCQVIAQDSKTVSFDQLAPDPATLLHTSSVAHAMSFSSRKAFETKDLPCANDLPAQHEAEQSLSQQQSQHGGPDATNPCSVFFDGQAFQPTENIYHSQSFGRDAFRSYPTSPVQRQRLPSAGRYAAGLTCRAGNAKGLSAHRSSHSLGSASSIGLNSVEARLAELHNASGSPVYQLSYQSHNAYFQIPTQRSSAAHIITDNNGLFDGITGQNMYGQASSAQATSPSTSMASTNISPLGSARLNPDGSFTSQEASFDSMSNTASEPPSRASSTSEELYFRDMRISGNPSASRPVKQKVRLQNIDRKRICDYSMANPNAKQEVIAARFGIERSTVSKILKQKEKWRAIDPQSDLARIAKHRAVKFPAIEEKLTDWVNELGAAGILIKDAMIRKEALKVARELGLGEDQFKASGGWIEKFRERQSVPKTASNDQIPLLHSSDFAASPGIPPGRFLDTTALAAWQDSSAVTAYGEIHTRSPLPTSSMVKDNETQKRSRSELEPVPSERGLSRANSDMKYTNDDSRALAAYATGPRPAPFLSREQESSIALPSSGVSMPGAFVNADTRARLQSDSVAAAHYAKSLNADAPAAKRRRSEPVKAKLESTVPAFDSNPSVAASGPPAMFRFDAGSNSEHERDSMQTDSELQKSVAASPSPSSRRSRPSRGGVQASSKRHLPSVPSPLHTATPELTRTLTPQSDCDYLSAMLRNRLDRVKSGEPSSVSAEEARQSLDLVLNFLSEQPGSFMPTDHAAVISHLQANINHLSRNNPAQENPDSNSNGPDPSEMLLPDLEAS